MSFLAALCGALFGAFVGVGFVYFMLGMTLMKSRL